MLPSVPSLRLYEITYDLRKPFQNYTALRQALIQAEALNIQQSTWWLPSALTAIEIRDVMLTLIDHDDSLNVVEMSGQVAGHEARPEVRAWIDRYLAAFQK